MSGRHIRVFHMSDLHMRSVDGPQRDRARLEAGFRWRVLGRPWETNLAELCRDGVTFDLVVFTGDLGDWGHVTDYPRAISFLKQTCATLNVPLTRLFVIPGNHDIERGIQPAVWDSIRSGIEKDPRAYSKWMAGGDRSALREDPRRDQILERQQAFWEAVTVALGRSDLAPPKSPHGRLGYRVTVTLPGLLEPIHVIGLDTAWLAGDERDSGRLRLTEHQVSLLTTTQDGEPLPGLRLALMHHGLSNLADAADSRRLLADRVDLLLHGHQHEPTADMLQGPDQQLLVLAAGCLYEGDEEHRYLNTCQVIDLDLDEHARPRHAEIRFRGWSARNFFWGDDVLLYQNAPGGRLRLRHDTNGWHFQDHRGSLEPHEVFPNRDAFIGRDTEPARIDAGPIDLSSAPSAAPVRPIPAYPDGEVRALSERLEDARARRQALQDAGIAADHLDREILDLRRQLREGGQLRAGDSLGDGRYLLVKTVGRGGFAVVWEAYDRVEQQRVAIKVLHSILAGDQLRRERFFRGAHEMMDLSHSAVVRVLEPKGEDGGFYYFVMEFIPGGNLREAILDRRLKRELVWPLLLRVAEAVVKAHAKGLVHRDIKPANILLDEDGNPKLTDFDLVSAHDTTGGTRTGALGTVVYAAPECLERPQEATTRADVFGLGMTALFCLSEQELTLSIFRNPERMIAKLDCSLHLKRVLQQAVAWEPGDRFADVEIMMAELRKALEARSEPTAGDAISGADTSNAGTSTASTAPSAAPSTPIEIHAQRRPLISLFYNSQGWCAQNIGDAPATEAVIFIRRTEHNTWEQPVRIAALATGELRVLKWLGHVNVFGLGVLYCGVNNVPYSTVCHHDTNKHSEGNAFPGFKDSEAFREWAPPKDINKATLPSRSPNPMIQQLVATIEKALGDTGIEVISPAHLPDREIGRLREVDVLLRTRIGSTQVLVVFECKDLSRIQGMSWIDELIGLKRSTGVDKLIAVSASGFTTAAIEKAHVHGIDLSPLWTMTVDEVCRLVPFTELGILRTDFRIMSWRPGGSIVDTAEAVRPVPEQTSLEISFTERCLRVPGTNELFSLQNLAEQYKAQILATANATIPTTHLPVIEPSLLMDKADESEVLSVTLNLPSLEEVWAGMIFVVESVEFNVSTTRRFFKTPLDPGQRYSSTDSRTPTISGLPEQIDILVSPAERRLSVLPSKDRTHST